MSDNGLREKIKTELLEKLTADLSKENYREFYEKIINYVSDKMGEIVDNVSYELQNRYDNLSMPIIVQSYLTQEEYKEYIKYKEKYNENYNLFTMENDSIDNTIIDEADDVIDSFLESDKHRDNKYIIDFLCINQDREDIKDELKKLQKNNKVKIEIEKSNYYYKVAKEFITCVLNNQQNILPYLPLNDFVYRITIHKKDENLINHIKMLLEKYNCVVNPILIWNVESKKYPTTLKRTCYYDNRRFFKVEMEVKENSHPYFVPDNYDVQKTDFNNYIIKYEEDKDIKEIIYYELNSYENFLNELSKISNKKHYYYNKLKTSLLPKNSVKTKAEIEIFFNLFEHVNNLKLVEIEVDDSELYVKKYRIFNYNYNIFPDKKKCKLLLTIEPKSKLKTKEDRLLFEYNSNFIAAILDDYLPGYWCEVELKYE